MKKAKGPATGAAKAKNTKKGFLSALIYNDTLLFIFSLIVAVAIWLYVSVELSPEVTTTIKDVPVSVDYTKVEETLGLKPFGESEYTVNVTVKGKKYIITSKDISSDLTVTADTSLVNSSGTYSLRLECKSMSSRPNYTIEKLSLSDIEVYFDYEKEEEFLIEPNITFGEGVLSDDYCLGEYVFPSSQKITVTGPENEINKLEKIKAYKRIEEPLTHSETVEAEIVPVTKDGSVAKYLQFSLSSETVKITVPVYRIASYKLTCNFKNKPSGFIDSVPFGITVSPSTAILAVPTDKADDSESFAITTVDFSSLKPGKNIFTVKDEEIQGAKVYDGTEEFTVMVAVENCDTLSLSKPENIEIINKPENINAAVSEILFDSVTLVGSKSVLEEIDTENIRFVADLSQLKEITTGEYELNISVESESCWLYGNYTVMVKMEEKANV